MYLSSHFRRELDRDSRGQRLLAHTMFLRLQCRTLGSYFFGDIRLAVFCLSLVVFTGHQRKNGIAAFLPAFRVWCWEILAENPVISIFQDMTLNAFRIHQTIVEIGIIWLYSGRSNLWDEKLTPGHSFIPSLFSFG